MNRSLDRAGGPSQSTERLDRSYGRTDGRTHVEGLSLTSETSRFVTRTRTYEFEDAESAAIARAKIDRRNP